MCRRCGGAVIAGAEGGTGNRVGEYYPAGKKAVDQSIPERARRFLQEAIDGAATTPSGSIVVAASAVDSMLKELGYKSGDLKPRIDQAAQDHLITDSMATWAHQVRLDANAQRHADENVAHPVEADAQQTLEFALALGEYLFILPSRVKRGIEASASLSPSASPSPSSSASPSS